MQIIASYYEYNVSSTHTIIGCLVGFAMTYRGSSAVQWAVKAPNDFPPYKGAHALWCAVLWHATRTAGGKHPAHTCCCLLLPAAPVGS
jgi:hypothetical protein